MHIHKILYIFIYEFTIVHTALGAKRATARVNL